MKMRPFEKMRVTVSKGPYPPAELIRAIRELPVQEPDWNEVFSMFGRFYVGLGRYQDAETVLTESIRLRPDNAEAHYSLGVTYAKLGQYEGAVTALREAIRLKPGCSKTHKDLGTVYFMSGQYEEAAAALCEVVRLEPDLVEVWCNLGAIYGELGRYDDAEAAIKRALSLKPDYADAHNNLGACYLLSGRLEEAEVALKRAVNLESDYAKAHSSLGVTYAKLGQYEEAEIAFREAIRLEPMDVTSLYNIGVVCFSRDFLEKAESVFKDVICHKPDYVDAHYALGIVYLKLGRYKEVETYLKEAIHLESDHDRAYYYLGAAYVMDGRFEEAEAIMEEARRRRMKNHFGILEDLSHLAPPHGKVLSETEEKLFREKSKFSTNVKLGYDMLLRVKDERGLDYIVYPIGYIEERIPCKRKKKLIPEVVPFPTPLQTKWEDISLTFIDGYTLRVRAKGVDKVYQYSLMGFMNKNTGNPNKQWELLRIFSENEGAISWENIEPKVANKVKKRKQVLSDTLKSFFRIQEDPFHPYNKKEGWVARFNISKPP